MKSISQYIKESQEQLSDILENIIYDENFQDDNYSIFDDNLDDEELRIKLIDGYCLEVCQFISDYYEGKFKGIEYYLLDDGNNYHYLMFYNDLWYDAYNYQGVKHLDELKFIELNKSYQKYDDGELCDTSRLHFISKDEFDYNKAIKLRK